MKNRATELYILKQLENEEHIKEYEVFINYIYLKALKNIVSKIGSVFNAYYIKNELPISEGLAFDEVNSMYRDTADKKAVSDIYKHWEKLELEFTPMTAPRIEEIIGQVVDVELKRASDDELFLHETAYIDVGNENRNRHLYLLSMLIGYDLGVKRATKSQLEDMVNFKTKHNDFKRSIYNNSKQLNKMIKEILEPKNVANKPIKQVGDEISDKRRFTSNRMRRLLPNEMNARRTEDDVKLGQEVGIYNYTISAVLDHRTSYICGKVMNGRSFSYLQYEIGTTAPPFHVNCRSIVILDPRDILSGSYFMYVKENGDIHPIKTQRSYEDWLTDGLDNSSVKSLYNMIEKRKKHLTERVKRN